MKTDLDFLQEYGDRESVMKIAHLIKNKISLAYTQPQKLRQLCK